jgi:predicted enzyme related to lactoylglutathione lyase
MVRGIKFVGIPVTDQDVALKFYTEVMGFKVTTDQPFNDKQRWIEVGIPGADTGLALFTPDEHQNRIGQFQSISFWCDDVFATAKALKEKGAVLVQEPKTEDWGTAAIFQDPDGNKFVLSSRGKPK